MKKQIKAMIFSVLASIAIIATADACTRVVHNNDTGYVFTGRTMDWKHDPGTNIWVFPAGMERVSPTKNPMKWTSKYGSVFASGYDISNTDGMNERGLGVNALWLVESEYPTVKETDQTLSLSMWAQYILDNYSSVKEAVEDLKENPLNIVTTQVPNEERMATIHLSLSDGSGDSAVIEYIAGKQVIYHGAENKVLTNSPEYNEQLILNKQFKNLGEKAVLMGANNAVDRFSRADHYNRKVSKSENPDHALATILSIMKTVSVPVGMKAEDLNLSTTQWTSVLDHNRMRYYFQPSYTQNLFYLDLTKLDFNEKTGNVMKLNLGERQAENVFYGEVNQKLQNSSPMPFL